MRYRHEDLICPRGHRARILLGDDEPIPTCTTCDGAMHLLEDDTHNGTEHVQVFKPFTYEGVHYTTQEQWNAHKKSVADNLKIPLDQLVESPPDRAKDRVRADEAAHRGWLGRKRAGGEEVYREKVRDARRASGKDATISVGWRGTR